MQFLIPEIGDKVTLAEDWSFVLCDEYRNQTAIELLPRKEVSQPRTHDEVMLILEKNSKSYINDYDRQTARLKRDYDRAVNNPKEYLYWHPTYVEWTSSNGDIPYHRSIHQFVNETEMLQFLCKKWIDHKDGKLTYDEVLKIQKKNNYDYWKEGQDRPKGGTTTLPKDSELTVDRIYIRKGASEFSSITFRLNSLGGTPCKEVLHFGKKVSSIRFWAKLEDVNKIRISKYVSKNQKEVLRAD